jgi:hypothetical protein
MPCRQALRVILRSAPALGCALAVAAAIPAAPSGAEEAFFEIDPSRSQLAISPASQSLLPLPQAFNGFGFGNRVLPHEAQPGLPAGQLPNGDPSDGLTAGLGGLLRVDVGDLESPTQIRFVRESSAIAVLPSGSWRPSTPPVDATTVAPAGLALRFADLALDTATEVALRDLVFSVASAEAAALASTGVDAWSFPAGCGSPAPSCPALRLEAARFDVAWNGAAAGLRRGFRSVEPFANSAGASGSLTRNGSGDFELTLPIAITLPIAASDLNDPLGMTHTLELTGQVVAVPEPSAALGALAALLALATLARVARRRSDSRALRSALVIAGCIAAVGCKPSFDPSFDRPSFYTISCQFEFLAVRKDGGAETIFADAGNQPCSLAGRYFEGTFAGTSFNLYSKVAYQFDQPNFTVGITMEPSLALLVNAELDYRAGVRVEYGATEGGGPAQLYFGGLPTGFGSASGEFTSGFVEIGGFEYPLDGMVRYYDLNPAGGTVDVGLRLESLRMASGLGYQGAALQIGARPNTCLRHRQCRKLDAASPFCALDGLAAVCVDGGVGSPCTHSAQCDEPLLCNLGVCSRIRLDLRF